MKNSHQNFLELMKKIPSNSIHNQIVKEINGKIVGQLPLEDCCSFCKLLQKITKRLETAGQQEKLHSSTANVIDAAINSVYIYVATSASTP